MNQPQQSQPQSPPPAPKYRFRWPILGVLFTIGAFFWLLHGIEASFQFEDLLVSLDVRDEERCVRLACLGVVLISATLIVKSLTHKSK